MNKDYQPIPMRPLTMRGVFGITWAVTKRHFFAGVMYTLIWVLIAAAVMTLCAAPAVIGIVANNAGQGDGVAALVGLMQYERTELDVGTIWGHLNALGGGAFDQGIIRYVIIMVLMLLFPLFGLMFHSGTRHAYALGDRKLVKGHRWQIVGLWLSGLLFVLPMAVCIVALIAQVSVSAVQFTMQWFENLMDMPSFSMLMPPKWLLAVTAVSAVLMLVTNPMRSLLPAIFLRGVKDEKEQEDAAA